MTGLAAAAPEAGALAGAPGTASGTPGVTIQGATYSLASVARVLSRLAAMPSLEAVRLTATSRVVPEAPVADAKSKPKAKRRTVVTFSIAANLRSGTGA